MEEDFSPGKIKRLKNLRLYADKTDEEIIEMLKAKGAPAIKKSAIDRDYEERFKEKFDILKSEFGLDMNVSNDVEMLNNLVRQMLQSESVDMDIRTIQSKKERTKEDVGLLKALGDFQRDIQITISDLQDKLGISRKLRKEKSVDDIPQFIDGVINKAHKFWDKVTVKVQCPTCDITLAQYWLNFPDRVSLVSFTSQCPHCESKVVFNK